MITKKSDIKFDKIDDYKVEALLGSETKEIWFFSCKTCGACVVVPDYENKPADTRNLEAHSKFHKDKVKVKSRK